MQVDWNECVGFVGGMLFVVQYIPQITKIIRFKHSDDISSAYLCISCVASVTTLVYGTLINSLSLVVTVSLSIGCKIVLLGLKRKYDTPLARHPSLQTCDALQYTLPVTTCDTHQASKTHPITESERSSEPRSSNAI